MNETKKNFFEQHEGKHVRIVLDTGFVLNGTIEHVEDDCIIFTTTTKTSLINFSKIMEAYPL